VTDTGEPVVGACVGGVPGVVVTVAGGVVFAGVGLGQLAGLGPYLGAFLAMVSSIVVMICDLLLSRLACTV